MANQQLPTFALGQKLRAFFFAWYEKTAEHYVPGGLSHWKEWWARQGSNL
jgi:hypothetical protein